jgi:predicted xylan-binding protein with Ca-dependent carbohydrate-binding module
MNKSLFQAGAWSTLFVLLAGGCAVDTTDETRGERVAAEREELSALTGCTAVEAETASHSGTGNVAGSGSTAGWRLFSNGFAEQAFNFTSTGKHTIHVTARGEGVTARQPNMRVSVGGVVLANVSITSTSNQSFNIGFTPPSTGNRTIRVEFTNDAVINGVDVNLIIDGWHVCPCHDFCSAGSLMAGNCGADSGQGTCIGQICAADSFCCQNSWDSTCIHEVFTICARDQCE